MRACPDRGLNQGRFRTIARVMAALEQIIACSAASLSGGSGRLLCLHDEPVAVLSDPDTIGAVTMRVGASTDLPSLLGMLTSMRPSGVLLVSSHDETHALAVELVEGRVVGAVGPEHLQSMGAWVVELHRRHREARGGPESSDDAGIVRALRPGRAFLREAILEALACCDEQGATVLLLEGEVQWLHERLETQDTQDFSFLLMELARRADETLGVMNGLGTGDTMVTPVSRPPAERRSAPQLGPSTQDFVDDPDAEASAEWLDARYVFAFCDGIRTIDGIVAHTLLGRFRTLSALDALVQHGHVQLVDGSDESAPTDELADLIAALI